MSKIAQILVFVKTQTSDMIQHEEAKDAVVAQQPQVEDPYTRGSMFGSSKANQQCYSGCCIVTVHLLLLFPCEAGKGIKPQGF